MTSKNKASQTRLLNAGGRAEAGYWSESRRPLTCLVFVSPLLVIYEAALVALGPAAVRNGAEAWLRSLLEYAGFSQYLLLPALTCFLLLGMHHIGHHPWRLKMSCLVLMGLECVFYAGLLLLLARWQGALLTEWRPTAVLAAFETAAPAAVATGSSGGARLAGFLGAGLYEELLFRLMLLPALAALAKAAGASNAVSLAVAVVVGSVLFSLAHYDFATSGGEPFDWGTFVFRFSAGVSFSLLYVYRGFGVAAGAHAMYDVLVVSV